MNKEDIPVITDREELYDKCENMEQLFDKYYLPLLDKHYSKTYNLRQQNQKYKEVIDKAIKLLGNYKHYSTPDEKQNGDNEDLVNNAFDILKEVE